MMDDNKYQKRRQKKSRAKPLSWTTFCSLMGIACLLLFWQVWSDFQKEREDRQHYRALRRAQSLLEQRGKRGGHYLQDEVDRMTAGGGGRSGNHHAGNQHEIQRRRPKKLTDFSLGRVFGVSGDNSIDNNTPDSPEWLQLQKDFEELSKAIRGNIHSGIRWIPSKLLKELPGEPVNTLLTDASYLGGRGGHGRKEAERMLGQDAQISGAGMGGQFHIRRGDEPPMIWEKEWKELVSGDKALGPKVDYTKHSYTYPTIEDSPPENYPPLETMYDMMKRWPQDSLDKPPTPFVERLMHFNFSDDGEREMARRYREAGLPFKLYDIPELHAANERWTDAYVSEQFDKKNFFSSIPRASGQCQESPDNFFAFFTAVGWKIRTMGIPPTRNNDWTFQKWSNHARYADAASLDFDQPHFYWQAGVPREERLASQSSWTFISRDLPSFSSPSETFFVFHPDQQKGIQCRFGERGVTAATHYDAGRNMVGMITGAKRYILSPPKECGKLGILTVRGSTLFRHSLLNFGRVAYIDEDSNKTAGMTPEERGWMDLAKTSMAIDTVLKAGEVLYIPSHWFHYITSLQKSAQCNVRSGVDEAGTRAFGGAQDVLDCV